MTKLILIVLLVASCGDNLAPPIPMAEPLPACPYDVAAADKVCVATGVCSYRTDRSSPAIACAAPCDVLPCDQMACAADDPTACTCEIDGDLVSCRAD